MRRSIDIAGFSHNNPIPVASRVGNLVMSGAILGKDAAGALPDTLEEQCALIFLHIRDVMAAAGGSPDDIIKVNVWLRNPLDRTALNDEWVKLFPDPARRPARHSLPYQGEGRALIVCDITAVIEG